MLGIQMIDRIEYIHSLKIIHANLKPNSFLIGKNSKSHILFLSDFCSAKKYWMHNAHIEFSKEKINFGSAKFLSLNA
jgi:serine/threonine protein kinase